MDLLLPPRIIRSKEYVLRPGNDHGARAVAEGAPMGGKGTTARTGTTTTAADRPVGTTGPGIV